VVSTKAIFQRLPGGTEEIHQKALVRIAGPGIDSEISEIGRRSVNYSTVTFVYSEYMEEKIHSS
jgi:hypothetical protein